MRTAEEYMTQFLCEVKTVDWLTSLMRRIIGEVNSGHQMECPVCKLCHSKFL